MILRAGTEVSFKQKYVQFEVKVEVEVRIGFMSDEYKNYTRHWVRF